jgi:hypothetical protein
MTRWAGRQLLVELLMVVLYQPPGSTAQTRFAYDSGMAWDHWLPEIIRRLPDELVSSYHSPSVCPLPYLDDRIAEALEATHLGWRRTGDGGWLVDLPGQTMILGAVRRRVEEVVVFRVVSLPVGQELRLTCCPQKTHDAHAMGAAAVILLAVTAWLIGGWTAGLPAGLTTLVGGGAGADLARQMAIKVLDRRLQRLTEDLASAIWPCNREV